MNPFKELGAKRVRDSKRNETFSAQRGLINQLVQFITEKGAGSIGTCW